MRHARIFGGLAAAIAATSLVISRDYEREGAVSYPYRGNLHAPNDVGPVTDSTPESKRAKRRRIAHELRKGRAA